MKTQRTLFRSAAATLLGMTAGLSLMAFADGISQPDPPVPMEIPLAQAVSLRGDAKARDPECRCAVLHMRDLEGRVDGHVEMFESMSRKSADVRRDAQGHVFVPLRLTSFVEGVVGFPIREYRLVADSDAVPALQ